MLSATTAITIAIKIPKCKIVDRRFYLSNKNIHFEYFAYAQWKEMWPFWELKDYYISRSMLKLTPITNFQIWISILEFIFTTSELFGYICRQIVNKCNILWIKTHRENTILLDGKDKCHAKYSIWFYFWSLKLIDCSLIKRKKIPLYSQLK